MYNERVKSLIGPTLCHSTENISWKLVTIINDQRKSSLGFIFVSHRGDQNHLWQRESPAPQLCDVLGIKTMVVPFNFF